MKTIALFLLSYALYAQPIYIVGGKDLQGRYDPAEIMELFKGQSKVVQVADQRGLKKQFIKRFLKMSSHRLSKNWAKLVFTGQRMAKPQFQDDDEVFAWLRRTPLGISYVSRKSSGIRVLYTISDDSQ